MVNPLKALSKIFSTKASKLIAVVIVAGLMTTTSAAVFTQYYANTTATVKTADISLVGGSDTTTAPTLCSVSPNGGTAQVGLTMYANAPTYYTDLLQIHNIGGAHTIQNISISGISDADSQLGTITVYYYATQTDSPSAGTALGSFTISSTTGGSLLSSVQTIAASGTNYIEIVAQAKAGATANKVVSFTITIQWA